MQYHGSITLFYNTKIHRNPKGDIIQTGVLYIGEGNLYVFTLRGIMSATDCLSLLPPLCRRSTILHDTIAYMMD